MMRAYLPVRRFLILVLTLGIPCLAALPARAVIITDASSGRNTTAPTGPLADSGWQYEGAWGGGVGTPIAPGYFITAAHLGGSTGGLFNVNGVFYAANQEYTDPTGSDLAIWSIKETFSSYAPLYTTNDELNRNLVVFGRGTDRGAPLLVGGNPQGWYWGNSDGALSWGTNVVTATGPAAGTPPGNYLQYAFNPALGSNTGTLSSGDSGGGVFIQKNGVWELAGVNFGVDGPYNFLGKGDPNYKLSDSFNAAVYDQRGLYFDGDFNPIAPANAPNPLPAFSYSSRVSSDLAWIENVASVPEPGSLALTAVGLLVSVPFWVLSWRRQSAARAAG